MPSRFGSVALVIVGVIFLLHNLNVVSFRMIGDLLRTWWPVILIVVGLLGLIGRKGK